MLSIDVCLIADVEDPLVDGSLVVDLIAMYAVCSAQSVHTFRDMSTTDGNGRPSSLRAT